MSFRSWTGLYSHARTKLGNDPRSAMTTQPEERLKAPAMQPSDSDRRRWLAL